MTSYFEDLLLFLTVVLKIFSFFSSACLLIVVSNVETQRLGKDLYMVLVDLEKAYDTI